MKNNESLNEIQKLNDYGCTTINLLEREIVNIYEVNKFNEEMKNFLIDTDQFDNLVEESLNNLAGKYSCEKYNKIADANTIVILNLVKEFNDKISGKKFVIASIDKESKNKYCVSYEFWINATNSFESFFGNMVNSIL